MQRHWRSWLIGTFALVACTALALGGCGPEASRAQNGGLGGSFRPTAPPTVIGEPALVVRPTMNTPYASPGALPTLRPAAPGTPGTPIGNPVATANPTPQAPTAGSPTPGAGTPTPTR